MAGVLRPSGHLFLEVPNLSGHRRLPIDDNRSHLHFFSPTSLSRMLADVGLETIATVTDVRLDARYADSLQVIARPFDVPTWPAHFLSDHPDVSNETNIVVWGAGSLADEILANFFDASKIGWFIDANPAKQAGLCLGKRVLPPESLGDAPQTILINSIDFADTIAENICRVSPGVKHRLIRIGDLLGD